MAAGVPAVLGTLPGADENATRDLMIGFHREMSQGHLRRAGPPTLSNATQFRRTAVDSALGVRWCFTAPIDSPPKQEHEMNRRNFVSRVALGGALPPVRVSGHPSQAAAAGQVNVRFVGMMAFVERADRSFLVATPGQQAMHHMTHMPFLMARKRLADREGAST